VHLAFDVRAPRLIAAFLVGEVMLYLFPMIILRDYFFAKTFGHGQD